MVVYYTTINGNITTGNYLHNLDKYKFLKHTVKSIKGNYSSIHFAYSLITNSKIIFGKIVKSSGFFLLFTFLVNEIHLAFHLLQLHFTIKYHLVLCLVDFPRPSTKEASLELKICLILFFTWSGKAWLTTMSWAGCTGPMPIKAIMRKTD